MTEESKDAEYCADQLKALSDPLRLRIVTLLKSGEMTVGDIALFLESEMVTVSHHLQILKHARILEVRRDGRFMVYKLRDGLLKLGEKGTPPQFDLGCCRLEVPTYDSREKS